MVSLRGRRVARKRLFGRHSQRAVEADRLAVEHPVLGDLSRPAGRTRTGWPRRCGKGTPAPRAWRASSGRAASSGVSNRPGAIVHDADAAAREVARGRERHARRSRPSRPSRRSGRSGRRTRRSRRSSPRRRARRPRSRSFSFIAVGREPQHVEHADQVHARPRSRTASAAGGPLLADRPLRPADARAADREAHARRRPRPAASTAALTSSSAVTSQCSARAASPSSPASASAFSSFTSAIATLRARARPGPGRWPRRGRTRRRR